MEDMDIDLVMDVPDTPDRLSARRMNRADCIEKESNLSVAGYFGGSDTAGEESLDRLGGRGRLVAENGHNRKHYIHPRKHSGNVDEIEHRRNAIVLSSLKNARENAPLFRRTMERSRNSSREQYMDKGKDPFSKLPSKSSVSREDHAILDLTEQSRHNRILEMAFPPGGSKNCLAEGRREGQGPRNSGSYLRNASNNAATSRDNCKGKEKVDDIGFKRVGSVMDDGKGMGRSHGTPLRTQKQLPVSHHSIVSPRAIGQKRLVRNGCISPENIAIRAKQLNEQYENSSKAEQDFGNVISSSPRMTDIRKIIAEDNNYVKGKGVVHPHTSKEYDMHVINLFSSPMSNNGEVSGIRDSGRDACFEEKGGWRSTHNHSKNVDHAAVHQFSRFNNIGCQEQNENRVVKRGENNRIGCDFPENQDATETAPLIVSKFNQISEPSLATNMLPKRQKKHELTSRNSGESSRVIRNDSDIVFLGSSRGSSSSRSSNIHIGQHLDVLDLDESSEMRGTNANNMDCVKDEDSEARARQVEADEMLARELQEQFYHEVPIFGDGEIDENIAWALQQEEDALRPTTTQSHREPNQDKRDRGSIRHSRVQPSSRIFLNSSNRRGGQARFPTSARMSRLRSRVLNESRAAPTRTRNFRFPLDMDLDMRLDILEAMEAAIGDDDSMGMASHIFQERDFNENDYEMLLALDENNHQHGGASISQINSLPLSKVQTDNFDEACAICLETPSIGETIRHLPCLHKFHKECIDPWLSRKTSCPVCKSHIT
ncbi:RING/U-box superfamily protein, putative isoform 1 [Theobroma cacao]|uniref:RING/U-box superfamily protein, putative isoform 1 n=1 Tax=Theobroma cacao TaxID=3641 RepID=A0A061EKI4_THECC|nr:RING/U-box superfamily protein, putative isoform 1 [Theobroma cacao]